MFIHYLSTFFIQSDIAALYIKVGLKNIGTVFLHTDAQIPDERFLVLINDMLASGLSFLSDCNFVDLLAFGLQAVCMNLFALDLLPSCCRGHSRLVQ